MAAFLAPLIGSLVSGGLGMMGASSAQADAQKQVDLANKQATQDWKYDEKVRKKTNKWNLKDYNNAVENEANMREWQDRLAISDWTYKTQMQDYEYNNAMRQYAQSEENYKKQLGFNNMAAAQAYEAEGRKLEEIKIGQAFQSQELMIENLIEEGQVRARGQSGRSAKKAVQSVSAAYGRNMAILEESMESAFKQYQVNLDKIDIEKMGADLQAEAARMLRPERMPSLPKPEALPQAKITKPMEIPEKKKPIAATAGSSAGAYLGALGDMAMSIAKIDFS